MDLPFTPAPGTFGKVGFGTTANAADPELAQCTGTSSTPTAPPGYLCLYIFSLAAATIDVTFSTVYPRNPIIRLVSGSGGDLLFNLVWAYTAP